MLKIKHNIIDSINTNSLNWERNKSWIIDYKEKANKIPKVNYKTFWLMIAFNPNIEPTIPENIYISTIRSSLYPSVSFNKIKRNTSVEVDPKIKPIINLLITCDYNP